MENAWLDGAMLTASLAAAGALGGIVGGAMRTGGGLALVPALIGVLPFEDGQGILPAVAVALTANLLLSAIAACRFGSGAAGRVRVQGDGLAAWAAGGAIGGLLLVLAGSMVALPVAAALVLGGVAMIAPRPASLARLTGTARAMMAASAGALSALAGAGGGTLGPVVGSVASEIEGQSAARGVALGAPAAIVLWTAAALGRGPAPVWLLGVGLVAGAAYLAAPLGNRLAAKAPISVLRAALAVGAVMAGFSALRAVYG